ncbi:hypothetical protein DYB28_005914 [Aphanomyces astaci]|uniref:BZIP domain-containing protein n=1 Tax=Aphanomyces astaci TaxID=112090 RepID=A0A9X8DUJ6_APHAT|nr:hypothetical protein DYB28_005914 [Aphanomyces astaci]
MRRPVHVQDQLYHEVLSDDYSDNPFHFNFDDDHLRQPIIPLSKEAKLARRRAQIAKSAQKHRLRIREEIEALQTQQVQLEAALARATLWWKEAATRERDAREASETINKHLRQMLRQTKSCAKHWRDYKNEMQQPPTIIYHPPTTNSN